MKRPNNLEQANIIIEKLLYELAYEKINSAKKEVPSNACPFKVLDNPMGAISYCDTNEGCHICVDNYWYAYEKMIYKKYELEVMNK